MTHLVYVTTIHGTPSPQVIFGGSEKPYLCEGIRRRMWPGEARKLSADEEADVAAGALTLAELARRHPASGAKVSA